jgi:hypothetical protein
VPLALALAWGAGRIVDVAYRELITPFEVVTPIALRIVAAAPDAVAAVAVTWLLGEAAGGLGAREVVLGRRSPLDAAVRGWAALLRRPLRPAIALVATSILMLVAVGPGLAAVAASWGWVRRLLWDAGHPVELAIALAVFVTLWLGALALAGFASALRSHVWTAVWLHDDEGPRAAVSGTVVGWPVGTIGDSEPTRPGGWPSSGASGTV